MVCGLNHSGSQTFNYYGVKMIIHSKNEMVVMTISYGYFSWQCMYSLL